MSIKIIKGDIFNTKADIICHGVNCNGGFGSGIAGQIAKRWPRVRDRYLEIHNTKGWSLGDVGYVYSGEDKSYIIANMATQQYYGYDGNLYADYSAIYTCLDKVLKYANQSGKSVAMPKVGCGLAGADWKVVYAIIYFLSSKYDHVAIEVYEYDK